MRPPVWPRALALAMPCLSACLGEPPPPRARDADTDAVALAPDDVETGPTPASTAHCVSLPSPPTAFAGGRVTPGPLRAGVAEGFLDLPVGSTLGAYTARARVLSPGLGADNRQIPFAAGFHPSVGYEHAPRVKALAISAGEATVVLLKSDLGVADDRVTAAVSDRLGPRFAGQVLFATSHSHSAPGHYVTSEVLYVGFGVPHAESFDQLVDRLTEVARRALDALEPARIGFAHDPDFDPTDAVSHDRRGQNDDLPDGAHRKDRDLFVMRVDRADGSPMAVVPIVGVHGTVLGEDNNLASGDAPAAIEQSIEESFERPVLVMHLQGAAGDVSPSGRGGIDCMGQNPCYNFSRVETVGRAAREAVRAMWQVAGSRMTDRMALEMVTRVVPLGPDARAITARGGALRYLPFDLDRYPDGVIFDAHGGVVSPVDEFNAPMGAALCGDTRSATFPNAQVNGTLDLAPYRSCALIPAAATVIGPGLDLPVPTDRVACGSTRTTVSAIRLGDWYIATIPGEPVTLLADRLRAMAPTPPPRTIVVGYAQGHIGYVLTADDWLRGGYEPSINVWGPIEGEAVMEHTLAALRMVTTDAREDATVGAAPRWIGPATARVAAPDESPRAGQVPAMVPPTLYVPVVGRGGARPSRAQPMGVARLDLAHFVWVGEDPRRGTPRVTLQRETAAGNFVNVTRASGRPVQDGDLLVAVTPDPLRVTGAAPRTWYWAVEWQAATPQGTTVDDALDDRMGLPLGRYRFRVDGTGYQVNSDPFAVTVGALAGSVVLRDANTLEAQVGYEARLGYRLLDLDATSNRRVPLRRGPVTVNLTLRDGTSRRRTVMSPSAPGVVAIARATDVPDLTRVVRVQVIDRFGNTGDFAVSTTPP